MLDGAAFPSQNVRRRYLLQYVKDVQNIKSTFKHSNFFSHRTLYLHLLQNVIQVY